MTTAKVSRAEMRHRVSELRLPDQKPLRIVVAGEVILDRYVWGDVERVSPEAPIPILRASRREEKPGNAGFVMANLRALGALPVALSVVGNDRNGRMLQQIFRDLGIDTRALLVSDIDKGLLTPTVLRALIDAANQRAIPIIVDPRLSDDYSIYRGATVLTPNRYETERATGLKLTDRDAWRAAAEKLIEQLDLQACLITLDRDGMYLAEHGGRGTYIPTAPREVYDVTGAGDIVLAFFGFLTAAGMGFVAAAEIANLAAGIEVGRLGTEIISREDLARALQPAHARYEAKIVSEVELKTALDRERRAGHKIVFTNGCFDLLHAGHLQILGFSRAHGDVLVVGLNSDRSVRAIKGADRPIYDAADRARLIAALEMVSYVVVFDDPRAERIIRRVR